MTMECSQNKTLNNYQGETEELKYLLEKQNVFLDTHMRDFSLFHYSLHKIIWRHSYWRLHLRPKLLFQSYYLFSTHRLEDMGNTL